tara:strand:+ start:3271 stop:3690 length:420 start_codon:yes stop_codon:yes gene_type:complete
MGRENTFKKYLMEKMGTRWAAQSHEDQYSEGIPDVSFGADGVNGWIELKQIAYWPKRESTLVKPAKYTPEQVNWLRKRNRMGGHCYVLIKVGSSHYFLFGADAARKLANGVHKNFYFDDSIHWWSGSIDPAELIQLITT